MLSGTGPASHLRDHGITVVVDQPMVGQGMTDNPMNVLFIPSHISVEVSLIQVVDIASFGSYIEHPVVQALFQLLIRDLLKTMSQLKSVGKIVDHDYKDLDVDGLKFTDSSRLIHSP
ncbi:hypothetical protein DKX38_019090 [Salix brachista]|uniref:Uncharacterized protein n=1 Tax=Salix brachista TaxID=2182728 RepID=A0A5N5KPW1_9ROSI|nr:hypothetical protein DKX38_019090 [Salix brachista]